MLVRYIFMSELTQCKIKLNHSPDVQWILIMGCFSGFVSCSWRGRRQRDHWCWTQDSLWGSLCPGLKQSFILTIDHRPSSPGAGLTDQLPDWPLLWAVRRQIDQSDLFSFRLYHQLSTFYWLFVSAFRLFRYLDESTLFSRPTYAALLAVLDNYKRMTGQAEVFSSQQLAEQETFLKETVSNTELGRELFTFLYTKGNHSSTQSHSLVKLF